MNQSAVKQLKAVYQEDPVVRAILDVMKTYVRGIYSIKTHMMERHLEAEGHEFRRPQIIGAFRKLEQVGIGKYVEGRRGWRSRFELEDRVTVIGKLLRQDQVGDIDLEALELEAEEDFPEETLTHSFQLRSGFKVLVELPTDLTQREADRLSQFFGCLALEEDQTDRR